MAEVKKPWVDGPFELIPPSKTGATVREINNFSGIGKMLTMS
jgi:hypothetical protein